MALRAVNVGGLCREAGRLTVMRITQHSLKNHEDGSFHPNVKPETRPPIRITAQAARALTARFLPYVTALGRLRHNTEKIYVRW
jgi:hypothetical protein